MLGLCAAIVKVGSPAGIRTPIRSSRGCSPTVERPGCTENSNSFCDHCKTVGSVRTREPTPPALESVAAVQGVAMPTSDTFPGMVTGTITSPETDYAEMARRPLEAEHCALIVVDMQEKLLPPIWEKERLVRNIQLLIRLAGILKIPALVTTQYAKGLGNTVPEIASLLPASPPSSPPIDKLMFSC